ncbi:MAG: hypothetical protein Q8L66_11510 [Caulobacter sp.]|nr:hypothetical protein [Caulobacter sp.]
MRRRETRFLAPFVAALAIGAAAPVWAAPDDSAERRQLAGELMGIVPYSDAEGEQESVQMVLVSLRTAFGDAMTPYAEREASAAALEAWRKAPSVNQLTRTLLETRLTADELREAIAYTRSPIAAKVRAAPARAETETPGDYIARLMTPAEYEAFLAIIARPGIRKYMTVVKEAGEPLGKTLGADLRVSLDKRCPQRTEPLPWCR